LLPTEGIFSCGVWITLFLATILPRIRVIVSSTTIILHYKYSKGRMCRLYYNENSFEFSLENDLLQQSFTINILREGCVDSITVRIPSNLPWKMMRASFSSLVLTSHYESYVLSQGFFKMGDSPFNIG